MRKTTIHKSEDRYKWSQTEDSLTISFPVRNVQLKQIDVVYAEYVLKVNAPRFVQVIDFPFSIDFANPLNKVQLTDNSLEVFLIKKDINVAPWTELQITGLNQAELTERRNKSLDDYYAYQEAERKKTIALTHFLDHEAVRQQMAVETHQREHIENTKKQIHDKETDVLQAELDMLETRNKEISTKARKMAFE